MQNNRVELLAPAGNIEGFYGAIHAGADAVYLGGNRFGARAYADNFTTEELVECIRYAHLWNRRVYLTVNTLVKETEFSELYEYLLPFYEAGLDGVIVQDIGVFVYVKEHFPGMELHVSTQMTLTGEYGAQLLKNMGACRIVPARELSLQEIKNIKQKTDLEIETFIHGAMCYCYSGQCLFSSILGGRSGNRGRCAQPCRLPYSVKTEKKVSDECYPLSLKDMCTIEHIPELISAGIDSFKIEGRMKKPEYTAGVTAIYRKYIDKYYQNAGNPAYKFKVDANDLKVLSCLYIRSERQDGYYYKHNGKDMITLSSPAYSGSDEQILAEIRHKYLENKLLMPVSIYADFTTGNRATVTLVSDDIGITVEGDMVQKAAKQPISKENIHKQLCKLGGSCFTADRAEIAVSEDAFYPLRAINELRREAVLQLENALLEKNGFAYQRQAISKKERELSANNTKSQTKGMVISVRRKEQLQAMAELLEAGEKQIFRLYLDCDLFTTAREDVISLCAKLVGKCEQIIALPYIIRAKDEAFLEKNVFSVLEKYPEIFSGILVRSMEGMGMIKSKGYEGRIYTDAGFYIWNCQTIQAWSGVVDGFCMPLELKGGEQQSLTGFLPCEKIVYGRIPMMITANCVVKTTTECRKGKDAAYAELTDRYHKTFPVEINCNHCMNIIYNSVPLSLHNECAKWQKTAALRLDFTMEGRRETTEIAEYFMALCKAGYPAKADKPPYKEYTTGHEKRGVE